MSRFEGRTEKPTGRRKTKARREGRIARSQEVGIALTFLGALLSARTFFPAALGDLQQGMRVFLSLSGTDPSSKTLQGATVDMLMGLVPFLGLAVLLAIVGGIMQTGFSLSPGAMKPKLSHLSPAQGLQRLKPTNTVWETIRSALKLGLLALFVVGPVQLAIEMVTTGMNLDGWMGFLGSQSMSILLRVAVLATVIAAADYAIARFKLMRTLKMTKQEVKQEGKDSEGDPTMKGKRRQKQFELSRNRMILDVTQADVLVMNPTHFAVALKYTMGEPAPRVVAKGAGEFALKLRSIAYRHGVLVKQDPPLARTLFRRCKIGSYVPAALYEAVAVILATAYRRRRKGVA
ncbi:MAG: EscU/YscU/HrcU family type III secretion system export apparatus switch protein [Actinomycetota bacterium]